MMVTTDRSHAVIIPDRPGPLDDGRHLARPPLDDEHPRHGDDAEDRGGHRTVQRVDEHVRIRPQKRNESLREAIQGIKTDPPTVHRRPKQPFKV